MGRIKASMEKCDRLRQKAAGKSEKDRKLLFKENEVLREALRTTNTYITEFLDVLKENKLKKVSSMGYKYGTNGKLKQTKEEKLKHYSLEEENYGKLLGNMSAEYSKVKARLFQVQDHHYVINLKEQIVQTGETIKELESANAEHRNSQFIAEKKMNQLINKGQNDAMSEIQEKMKEIGFLTERVRMLDQKIAFQEKTEAEIESRISNMTNKCKDKEKEANAKGLSLKNQNDEDDLRLAKTNFMKKKVEKRAIDTQHK